MDTLEAAIAAIAEDRRSGASALLRRGVELLRGIAADRPMMEEAAGRLCRAQPAMAGFRTLAALVRSAADPEPAIERFAQQVARAPRAIARNAVAMLELRKAGPLSVVTFSASQAVELSILAAAERLDIVVCCAEGRPQMEGRDLARRLADQRVAVELYTDAAIGTRLRSAGAVLVGADAVGPEGFINKVGTGALCALAESNGVPVYVLAGREKRLDPDDFAALELSGGDPGEVWAEAPVGVQVRNPYFELIPFRCVSAIISDRGVYNVSI